MVLSTRKIFDTIGHNNFNAKVLNGGGKMFYLFFKASVADAIEFLKNIIALFK